MKESKEDRFCRVAEARVNKIIKMMRLLGNCSNNAVYAFSPEQVEKFFLKWSNIIRELGSVFRKAEGKLKNSLMENIWTLTFVKLYLAYDMEKDFLPQFEDNSEDLLALMQFMPIPKGGEK